MSSLRAAEAQRLAAHMDAAMRAPYFARPQHDNVVLGMLDQGARMLRLAVLRVAGAAGPAA